MKEKRQKKSRKPKTNYLNDLCHPEKLNIPTRDNIITQIYGRHDFKKIIRKMVKDSYLIDELTSELYLYLCKMDDDMLIDKYNRGILDYSILDFLKKQVHSNNSPFYHKIRKHTIGKSMTEEQRQKYIVELEKNATPNCNPYYEALDNVMEAINSLPHKHMTVLKFYIELKNYKKVAERTGIPAKYISLMVKDARIELGKKIAGLVEYYKEENFIKELFENYGEDKDE